MVYAGLRTFHYLAEEGDRIMVLKSFLWALGIVLVFSLVFGGIYLLSRCPETVAHMVFVVVVFLILWGICYGNMTDKSGMP